MLRFTPSKPHHPQKNRNKTQTRHSPLHYTKRSCPWTPLARSETRGCPGGVQPILGTKFVLLLDCTDHKRPGIPAASTKGLSKHSFEPSGLQNLCRMSSQTPITTSVTLRSGPRCQVESHTAPECQVQKSIRPFVIRLGENLHRNLE